VQDSAHIDFVMTARKRTKNAQEPRFAQERQARIAETLREAGRVEVAGLARTFGVSEDTVRRDLRLLAARGLMQKTHGGAVALFSNALPMSQRLDVRPGPKRAIARAAAGRVLAHQTLFIDGGSTTLALAQGLAEPGAPRPLTVITAAFDVAALFAADPTVHLILAGGTWSFESREFFGEQAQATIRAHRADWAFLGACALHPRAGLTSTLKGDAQVKRAMIESARTATVAADSTKHDLVSPYAVAELREIDLVISDEAPSWLSATIREVVKVNDSDGKPRR
jgi:DeoR/GlpR family transcriptional regulator of sugar metabolism